MEKKETKTKKETTFFEDIQNLYMSADRLTKDTEGYNYKYVQLKDVLQEAKKLCLANNFIFIQRPMVKITDETASEVKVIPVLVTSLIHKSGEKVMAETLLPCKDSNDPQKYGGAITYMRRYSLTAILGLEETDDDGTEASKEPVKKINKAKVELNNIDRMKQILASQGAKSEKEALEIINNCGAFASEMKAIKDITEVGAGKIIKALTDDQDEED